MTRRSLAGLLLVAPVAVLGLAACTSSIAAPTATSVSPTAVPSAEPTASAPAAPRVFLLMSSDVPAYAAVQSALEEMAAAQGWALTKLAPGAETLSQVLAEEPMLVVSVATGLGPSLTQAAAAHGDVGWVAIDETKATAAPNMLAIGPAAREDQMAFLAGALAGLVNSNNRVGWIGEPGSVRGTLLHNGFIHGVRYTCPLCWVFEEGTPPGATAEAGEAAAAALLPNYIDTAGSFPGLAGDAALRTLAAGTVRVAGSRPRFTEQVFAGQPEAAKNILGEVELRPDHLLRELLPRFLAGEAFAEPLTYSIENGGLGYARFATPWITPGLQKNLEEMLGLLASGQLQIGIDPATGAEQ
jgi:basic membrane lipoprotein Med (substrate-binding protein (PBP1-ABC) superfamily)